MGPSANATDEQTEDYARRTSVPTAWVKERAPAARSYFAVAVEAHGEIWGAVVIDSRSERIHSRAKRLFDNFYGRILNKLLEEA